MGVSRTGGSAPRWGSEGTAGTPGRESVSAPLATRGRAGPHCRRAENRGRLQADQTREPTMGKLTWSPRSRPGRTMRSGRTHPNERAERDPGRQGPGPCQSTSADRACRRPEEAPQDRLIPHQRPARHVREDRLRPPVSGVANQARRQHPYPVDDVVEVAPARDRQITYTVRSSPVGEPPSGRTAPGLATATSTSRKKIASRTEG